MPTLREMSVKARELEEKIAVYTWLDTRLRELATKTDIRVENSSVQAETIDAIMADLLDQKQLCQNQLERIWNQPVGGPQKTKEEKTDDPPELEVDEGRVRPRRKG